MLPLLRERSAPNEFFLPGGFAVGGMDHDLAFFAHTDTFGANARHILQRQMHDATLSRRHGIQPKRLRRTLHTLGSYARGHAQLFKSQRAITAAVKMNFFVVGGL